MIDKPSFTYFTPSSKMDQSPLSHFIARFDWILLIDVIALSIIGIMMVYSASSRFGHPEYFIVKQLIALVSGFIMLFLFAAVNYQIFAQYPKTLFTISISLLLAVLLFGQTYRGTKAWISIGPMAFQTSEITKVLSILIVSGVCARSIKEIQRLKSLVMPFLTVLAHVIFILMQPDFGSTLVYFPILLGILFVAGARPIHLLAIFFYGIISGFALLFHTMISLNPEFSESHPVANFLYRGMGLKKEFWLLMSSIAALFILIWWLLKQLRLRTQGAYFIFTFLFFFSGWTTGSFFANSLMQYQRKRLLVFFQPGIDPMGAGYHVIQSMVALGSGKIFGRGFRSGTQGQLGFLPEQHTDFIFSVLGEEFGFVISSFVLFLYLTVIWRSISIAGDSRDRFGSMVAVGIGCMFAFYGSINLAMVMGLAPVTGLPLPFLSYGGSSLVASLAAVGILLSIHIHRYIH